MAGLIAVLTTLHQQQPSIAVGIVGNDLVVADTPMHKVSATMIELIRKLKDNKVERIAFERGVTQDELVDAGAEPVAARQQGAATRTRICPRAHIRVGRLKSDDEQEAGRHRERHRRHPPDVLERGADGGGRLARARKPKGMPDAPAALQTVDGLADAVTQNRTALMALTAMRNYDNYTFTHMVNVSILTMAQARALGIDGKLLREFGLSALMHDIGKVRTPKEILNKPGQADRRGVRHHAAARRRRRRDPAPDAGDADPRADRRLRASPAARRQRLSASRSSASR